MAEGALTDQEWQELDDSLEHLSGPDAWDEDRLEPALIPVTHYVPRLMDEVKQLRTELAEATRTVGGFLARATHAEARLRAALAERDERRGLDTNPSPERGS